MNNFNGLLSDFERIVLEYIAFNDGFINTRIKAQEMLDGECGVLAAVPQAEVAQGAPTLGESQWPSDRDAAIQACALMILGICKAEPQEAWPKRIEGRIRYMLSKIAPQPQAAEPKGVTDEQIEKAALDFVKKPGMQGYVEPGDLIDFARALLAKGE